MLVNSGTVLAKPQRRRFGTSVRLLLVGALLILLGLGLLAPYLFKGTELVRVRNALALGPDLQDLREAAWQPPNHPAGYKEGQLKADPFFADVVQGLGLESAADDWARALIIARHMLQSAPVLLGGAIQHDLRHTYQAIVTSGDGYCGDFVRVFSALARAAGIPVRTWAFSLDKFGGHGHIFAEIWNRQQQRWQLVDIFQNYYFTNGSTEPLSGAQFRQAVLDRAPELKLHRLSDQVPPGWEIEAKAWDYFQRGIDAWYMPWGNNPFMYDAAWPVRAFAGVSRLAEGVGAWAVGVSVPIRMLATPTNLAEREAMRSLRTRTFVATGALLGGGLMWSLWLLRLMVRVRPQPLSSAQAWPRACVVGPLPPPSGGMANQCEQLLRLLREEGAQVQLVRTNAPYRPQWVGQVPVLRAGFRLLPYLWRLWRAIGRAQVVHVFANSGWAWHLLAAPALSIARLRGIPAIVNYRGGQADEFLSHAPRFVHRQLARAEARITPSAFLQRVFARHGLAAQAIPNVVDLSRFPVQPFRDKIEAPRLLVTRNLEAIYDIPTVLRAFAQVRQQWPDATLTVAGSGPELAALQALSTELGVAQMVQFVGRVDNARIASLYAQADLVLNASTVDNMPISILEALASGVPVVSTAAGGIPDLVQDGRTAMLVPVGDAAALASAALLLLQDRVLARSVREAGLNLVSKFAWAEVRSSWQALYCQAAQRGVLA